jgi:predicted TIM-barrel fold metal-dependent hydrolase
LKGIAMINLGDVPDGLRELERAARLGLSGAMITEYPLEHRRYDQPEYQPFWAAAAALDMPLSLHAATRRQGRIRGAGEKTLRDASSRATKAFYPALSLCDLMFSGVFERHPPLTLAIVEFELAWAPHLFSTIDYTYRERHGEAIYRFKSLPSRRRGACPREGGGRHAPERLLPPQRRLKLPGGRHRKGGGVDNMM